MTTLAVIISIAMNVWLWYRVSRIESNDGTLALAETHKARVINSEAKQMLSDSRQVQNLVGGWMEKVNADISRLKQQTRYQPSGRQQ